MGQSIFGIQLFLIGVVASSITHDLTGSNFIVSVLVGFFGGGALFGGLMALAPRVMFFAMVAIYAVAGFSIARYFEWGGFETLILTLAFGGAGWAANVELAQDMYFAKTPADEDTPTESRSIKSAQSKPIPSVMIEEDKEELFDDAAIALASKLVTVPMYQRMCAEIEKMAGGTARADQPMSAEQIARTSTGRISADDKLSIVGLSELHLIRPDEWAKIAEDLDKLEAGDTPVRTPSPAADSGRTITHISQVDHADALFRLAECRAISMETFLRAMLQVDPQYPPQAADLKNFEHTLPDADAEIYLAAVFQAKLIDLEEFQSAIAIIKEQRQHAS